MKKSLFVKIIIFSFLFIFTTSLPAFSMNYSGWTKESPKYANTQALKNNMNKSDIAGNDIMSRLRASYTYNTRMKYLIGSNWVQKNIFSPDFTAEENRYWSLYTYTYDTPDGNTGYTAWYDSPYGIVLDYLTPFSYFSRPEYKRNPPAGEYSSDVIKDMIFYNKIQYGSSNQAYLASNNGAGLSDAKSAAMLMRDDSSMSFPIYLNNGKDVDSNVKAALDEKGVKTLYIMGGYERFNYTAGLTKGFNIVRIGGINSQQTLEFYRNMPIKMKNPEKYTGDKNGIVINGTLPNDLSWQYVYDRLTNLKQSKNINELINLVSEISSRHNIGAEPYKSQIPALVLGVSTPDFKCYWMNYYNNINGTYVYQFILPEYHSNDTNPTPTDNGLTIKKYDYKQNDSTFWVKKGNEFQVETNGYFAESVGDYPTRSYLGLAVNGSFDSNSPKSYGEVSKNGTIGTFGEHFVVFNSNNRASRNNSGARNYITYLHSLSGKKDLEEYKLYSNSSYFMNGTEYTSSWKDSGKWIKIDGIKPTITGGNSTNGWINTNYTISATASDNESGMLNVSITDSSNNVKTSGTTSVSLPVTEEGSFIYTVKALDNVRNEQIKTVTVKIDKTAPTATSYDVVDRQDDTFTIDIVGVTDGQGSGVKSQTVRVWIDTPTGRKEKVYTPVKVNDTTSRVVVNRLDYGGYTKTYYYELTLVDNVGNSRTYAAKTGTMIQNNLTAKRIDIYDPRENRYVSQVISGLQYQAVLEVENNGEREISKNFDIAFKVDSVEKGKITETKGIKKGEIKEYKFTFVAGEENLKGVKYEGIADYSNVIYETNENDNTAATKNPYTTPRSDENPPIIPPDITSGNKPNEPVPIITVIVDLEADFIDIVELNSNQSVTEVITDDEYRIKYRVKNNSSLALRNIDIINKTFTNKVYYDGVLKGQVNVSDINKNDVKTFYQTFKVPLLSDGIVEAIKPVRLDVDTANVIKESNETNNTIIRNKKIIGLKVIDYRITDVVNPITSLNLPLYTNQMPLSVKTGYNVTFNVDVLGKPDKVYAKVSDTNGKDYGIFEMIKIKDIDNVRSEWYYVFAPHIDTPDNTIIITEIFADRNSFTYNYNQKENWNGHTLRIGGNAREDIIIYRKY